MVTAEVSILAMLLGLALGLVVALIREAGVPVLRQLTAVYVSLVRGTPVLIQIFIVYYALPIVGIDASAIQAGILALSLNSAAFIAEIIRGGLTTVPQGQVEAARAVAMPRALILRRIIMPQTFLKILPPLTNEFTIVIKASALLSVITIVELTRTAEQITSETFRPIELYISAALLYFFMCFAVSVVSRELERRTTGLRA